MNTKYKTQTYMYLFQNLKVFKICKDLFFPRVKSKCSWFRSENCYKNTFEYGSFAVLIKISFHHTLSSKLIMKVTRQNHSFSRLEVGICQLIISPFSSVCLRYIYSQYIVQEKKKLFYNSEQKQNKPINIRNNIMLCHTST